MFMDAHALVYEWTLWRSILPFYHVGPGRDLVPQVWGQAALLSHPSLRACLLRDASAVWREGALALLTPRPSVTSLLHG